MIYAFNECWLIRSLLLMHSALKLEKILNSWTLCFLILTAQCVQPLFSLSHAHYWKKYTINAKDLSWLGLYTNTYTINLVFFSILLFFNSCSQLVTREKKYVTQWCNNLQCISSLTYLFLSKRGYKIHFLEKYKTTFSKPFREIYIYYIHEIFRKVSLEMISRSSEVILYPLTRDVASTDVRTKKRMPDIYICKVRFIFFMKINISPPKNFYQYYGKIFFYYLNLRFEDSPGFVAPDKWKC